MNCYRSGAVNAHFFLMGVAADFSRIGDAFAPCFKHPLEQLVFIFEEATSTEDITPGKREWGCFDAQWGDFWKDVTSRPRL